MIKLISGACRVGSKLMRPADKPFSLTEKEEAYLVEQGVAKYVTEEAPAEKVATPPAGQEQTATGVNSDDGKNGAEGTQGGDGDVAPVAAIVDGHFVKDDLMKLTRDKLNKLAEDLGIEDPDKCANKGEVADLIAAIEVGGDEGGELPNLGAEDPVV